MLCQTKVYSARYMGDGHLPARSFLLALLVSVARVRVIFHIPVRSIDSIRTVKTGILVARQLLQSAAV